MIMIDVNGERDDVIAVLEADAGVHPARGLESPAHLELFESAKEMAIETLRALDKPYAGVNARLEDNPGGDGVTFVVAVAGYRNHVSSAGETRPPPPKKDASAPPK